ncbi:putative uncharacterized protein BRD3OS isoform X1 [Leopardus geoffroyi]|uniref:putative uncharacterized protein BRD3OS isoform X1 n=1 Tax=Leopardus geoffroyi TaxID=46844 RepID=UPI001E2636A3|nr:putative uncharacterized protein BRD3OS isoform X1 [Leopardus geoffroyi]
MPAALPWRRGPEANGPRPRLRAPRPRARTSPRPLGAGDRALVCAQGPPRCLEQEDGAGGGHHPEQELRTKHCRKAWLQTPPCISAGGPPRPRSVEGSYGE